MRTITSMPTWLRRAPIDPLTGHGSLEGPARLRERRLITFATGLGPGLALLGVYDSPGGVVAMVHPAGMGKRLGGPMANFVESVAEEVRLVVPDMTQLLLVWPRNWAVPDASVIRVTFRRVLPSVDPASAGPRLAGFTTRYVDADLHHHDHSEIVTLLGPDTDVMLTSKEVDDLILNSESGPQLVEEVAAAKASALEELRAFMRELGME